MDRREQVCSVGSYGLGVSLRVPVREHRAGERESTFDIKKGVGGQIKAGCRHRLRVRVPAWL